ncbi:MAG: substrate-binding domain-containing protein [Cohaesibacter sp.]|nr:substrate-binding domain-containing protein [Cohaesibacter sp.]
MKSGKVLDSLLDFYIAIIMRRLWACCLFFALILASAALLFPSVGFAQKSNVQSEGQNSATVPMVPRIALISFVSKAEVFEAYKEGARRQVAALGAQFIEMDARRDPKIQVEMIERAIAMGVEGIILQHGPPHILQGAVQKAIDAGIAVVSFDVALNHEAVPQIKQSDADLVALLTEQMIKDQGSTFKVAYVHFPGIEPFTRRDAAWQTFKHNNPGVQELATFGTLDIPVVRYTANQARAVLTAYPDIEVIFASYDDFAQGVKLAVDEAGLSDKIRIYSTDITDQDIKAMREPGSPWVATAANNPYLLGEISVRAVAMVMAGEDPGREIVVKPRLITQKLLNKMNITSVEDLARRLPDFADQDIAKPDWMPTPER